MTRDPLLIDLEALAQELDHQGFYQPAEDLRTVIAEYFTPGLHVRYHYAAEWKTGVLLTRPSKDRPYWQVQRSGFGGYVDQVMPGPDTIRIYVDNDTTEEETA
jgi:hypothetical protein